MQEIAASVQIGRTVKLKSDVVSKRGMKSIRSVNGLILKSN